MSSLTPKRQTFTSLTDIANYPFMTTPPPYSVVFNNYTAHAQNT